MTSTREAMTLLRAANPVPATEPPRPPVPASPRRPRVGRLALAGAAAGVVAVALGVVPLPWPHGNATPAAAAALDKAATAADITAVDESARPDQYWRITTSGTSLALSDGASLVERSVTRWDAVDGSRPSWHLEGPSRVRRVLYGSALETDEGMTWTDTIRPTDLPGSWQTGGAAFLASLPRDTDALRDRLYDDTGGHGRSHDGEVLVYVADVLRTGLVPADLRAALFRVLETVPEVDIVQQHADGLISIGRLEAVDGERQEIIIDPETGDYVGERTIQVVERAGIPAGTVVGDATVTRVLVDEVPADVVRTAVRYSCEVASDGAVMCSGG